MVLSAVSGHGELPALIALLLCRIRVEIKLIHLYTTISVKTSGVERAPQTPRRRGEGRGFGGANPPPPPRLDSLLLMEGDILRELGLIFVVLTKLAAFK